MNDQTRIEERPTRPVTRLRRRSPGVAPGRPSPAAPAWPALIVILLAGVGAFALTDVLAPAGAWRTISDSLMLGLLFGAMAGWLRANRAALAHFDERAYERPALQIRYVASGRRPGATARRQERVRPMTARQGSPDSERRDRS